MRTNDKLYWDNRFKTDWQKFGGSEQTKFFTKLALKNLPPWLIKEIIVNKYSICDAGCAEGDSTSLLSNKFINSKISGFDFSSIAIKLAKDKYPHVSFFVADINKFKQKYDIIYCSNTLEHLQNPKKSIKHLLAQTNKHLIIQVPFQENNLFKEHYSRFNYQDLPIKINGFLLTFCRIKDTSINDSKYWPGKQLIAIYSKNSLVNNTIHIYPTISDKDYTLLSDKSGIIEKQKIINNLTEEINQKDIEINNYYLILNKIYNSKMWKIFGKYKKTIYTIKSILKKIVPIAIRKKIKSFVEAKLFTEQINNVIPPDVLNEWQNWNYGPRKDDSIDFINFSVIAWDFRFQRPQQLAKKLGSSNHRVFYIKNEFIPYTKTKSVFAPIKVEKKAKNVYEITLSATRNLFIYNDIPSEKDKKIILASIKNLINQAQIVNPIAKFDHPFWAYILEQLAMPSIYDCMDNHQGFLENAKHLSVLENKLLNNSNITLVTSKFLQKIATKNKAQNITLLPNAGDYQHFSEAADKSLKIPSDLSNIPHPIIGYYGALAEWFDTNILESVANKHSDKSIVLIGNVTNSKIESLSKKYKNIYLLGEKPYSELPSYLQEFDVCTIPFILSDLIKATHPVKIFEYLAAGKPVVATKMPEILEMQNIYFANQKDFSSQISTALLDKNKDIKKRQTIAKNNTWNIRSSDLISITNKILFPKISIVLLSYNNPEMVKNTIDSILTRTFYPNYELIIVDNKSDQKTIEVLYSYQSISQVKLIFNQENYGFAKGNNIGMKEARGDYLVLINNDVIVTPGWLSRLLYHIKPGIGLVGPVTNSIGNEAKINILYNSFDIKDLESKASVYTSSHWGNILKLNRIAAFCWIMSRSTYQQFGGLDEQYGRGLFEDDDYCLNLKKNDLQILCAEDVFIHHFGGASFKKIQNDEYYKLFNENKLKFEKKWKTKWVPHQYRK